MAFLNISHPPHTLSDSKVFSSDSQCALPHSLPESFPGTHPPFQIWPYLPSKSSFKESWAHSVNCSLHATHTGPHLWLGRNKGRTHLFAFLLFNLLQASAQMPSPSPALPDLPGRAKATLAALYPSFPKSFNSWHTIVMTCL